MSEEYFTTLKIIMLGSSSVGKTSILAQLVRKEFAVHKPTVSPEFDSKEYQYNGKTVRLALWDTAGQERFHCLPTMLFRGVQGAVLVYDVTNYKTFQDLLNWMSDLNEQSEMLEKQPVVTILGNKSDLDKREVSRQEGLDFARKHRALFLETSAKTNEGIETAFDDLVAKIMETPGLWKKNENYGVVNLHGNSSNPDMWYQKCLQC